MVIVRLNREKCLRCGFCTSICVRVFELDNEEESAQITSPFRTEEKFIGEIPENINCVKVAERKCPVNAIKTVDEKESNSGKLT
ncbi:hypothetical protein AKJ56_00455 [candidate division MSBL1 archaeon SCGC-AAA382N08]|uniref:4Fe-4S ferredoxin-type domain-containing protein n=1 Tax=candidate division MSBL1 archaeon SCGC-AAA382N08 TaxID=1698285 RepID=A0A133VQM4_9EURY|nr:hypothetical protein AKJ56_00455 [candidate division MSBL1 archaeon SCGC-AAA382N08]